MITLTTVTYSLYIGILVWFFYVFAEVELAPSKNYSYYFYYVKTSFSVVAAASICISWMNSYYKIHTIHITLVCTLGCGVILWMEYVVKETHSHFMFNMFVRLVFFIASTMRLSYLPQFGTTIVIAVIHCFLFPSMKLIIRVFLSSIGAIMASYTINTIAIENFILIKMKPP